MDDLYARLKPPAPAFAAADRAALRRDLFGEVAATASGIAHGVTVQLGPRSPGRRRRTFVVAAAASIAGLGIAGLVAVERSGPSAPPAGSGAAPSSPSSAWLPPGEEFPIIDRGPASETQGGPVVEALSRRIDVPGYAERIVAPSLTYTGGPTAELQACVWSDRGGSCRPEWNPVTWGFEDDADADGALFTFDGLPAGTAFATYTNGEAVYWQRPVHGFAAFPNLPGTDEVVTAWDADGNAVAAFEIASYNAAQTDAVLPPDVGLTDEVRNDVFQLTWSSMRTCLQSAGGEVNGTFSVAKFPDDVDQIVIWDRCVTEVKALIANRVAELT